MNNKKLNVHRITSLHLKNFRGFRGEHHLNTNADLILITGPNGYGKTSFMDALLLLLSGWHNHGYPYVEKLTWKEPDETKPIGSFELSADTKRENETVTPLLLRGDNIKTDPKEKPKNNWSFYPESLPRDENLKPELLSRLVGFFQDRIDQLFDETTSGYTLRDYFDPLPGWLDQAERYLRHPDNTKETPGEAYKFLKQKLDSFERGWQARQEELDKKLAKRSRQQLQQFMKDAWLSGISGGGKL